MPPSRVAWVDYAKGICIIMVVMMHATLSWGGLNGGEGWLHHVVEFARPFRMPDFFLLAGLFLGRSINAPLREYLDRKVLHFVYFYLLWLVIQVSIVEFDVFQRDPSEFWALVAHSLIWGDYQTLWFVHMLAVFYIVTRLLRKVPVWIVFLGASAMQIIYHTDIFDYGWTINRFFDRYVYFFVGYAAAPRIFEFAEALQARPRLALAGLAAWAAFNGVLVQLHGADAPFTSLIMGFAGAGAVIATGALLSKVNFARPLAYVGANSIVVYLSFIIAMKIGFKILLFTDLIPDIGWGALAVTAFAVITPLMFHYVIKGTPLNFLYVRPQMFRIIPPKARAAEAPIAVQPSDSTARGAK